MTDKTQNDSLTIEIGDTLFIDAGFKTMTATVVQIDAENSLITVKDTEGYQWVWEENSGTRILESLTPVPGGSFEIHPIMNITKQDSDS